MIKRFDFNYDSYEAGALFKVDTSIFTAEHANATLEFFTWDYDKEADPIEEVMKKYALEAIQIATFNNYNEHGVISEFEDNEGFARIDGSLGITLISVQRYEFGSDDLVMTITNE